jgi:hypothetical protein
MISAGAEVERNTSIVIWTPMRKSAPNAWLQHVPHPRDEGNGVSFTPGTFEFIGVFTCKS